MAGKTNAKWVRVWVDDTVPTLRDISLSCNSVTLPINSNNTDVTGYSDGVVNVTMGHPNQPVSMGGPFSDAAAVGSHTVLSAIVNQATPTVTVKVQIGILAAPSGTDPEYLGEFLCVDYNVNLDDMTWTAEFIPGSTAAPIWGTYT